MMDPKYFLVLAVAVIMGWYALGTIINVRRGEQLLRWMQAGLPQLGEKTTFRWLGSSVVELVIGKGKAPVKRAEVLLVLKPRDVVWTWLYATLRGRHDILIVRIDLPAAPRLALELAHPKTWTGQMALHDLAAQSWESRACGEKTLAAPAGHLQAADVHLEALQQSIRPLPGNYASQPGEPVTAPMHRFGLRREAPHLEVHLPFPNPKTDDARAYFTAIRDLAIKINKPSAVSDQPAAEP